MKRHIKRGEPVRWRLKKAREDMGLTLREVSERTNYSYGTLARAETGDLYKGKKPDIRRDAFWKTMSEFYQIPAEELMKIGDGDE